jgi:hypothetical protein
VLASQREEKKQENPLLSSLFKTKGRAGGKATEPSLQRPKEGFKKGGVVSRFFPVPSGKGIFAQSCFTLLVSRPLKTQRAGRRKTNLKEGCLFQREGEGRKREKLFYSIHNFPFITFFLKLKKKEAQLSIS